MSSFPWLPVLVLLPLIGAVGVAVVPEDNPRGAKIGALAVTLVELVVVIGAVIAYNASGARFQLVDSYTWIPAFGTRLAFGVDGIALVMLGLIAVLMPIVVLGSWGDDEVTATGDGSMRSTATPSQSTTSTATPSQSTTSTATEESSSPHLRHRNVRGYFALLLVLETCMVGVFAATDLFLFYVFFEVMLVPMYFLIGSFGGPRRQYAAVKFFLYSLAGGLLMLAAVIALYVISARGTGQGSFAFSDLVALNISSGTQKWLFLGFFIAFAIKAPLVPFHTWLPDAGAEAPIGSAVLLVGVLDKVGTFGFLRYCLPLFPDASKFFAPVVLILAVVGIFYGAFLAMGQQDLKRLVSYTSIAHFGFIALGIFAFTSQGGSGAVLYMVNHGLSTGALFLILGVLIARRGSRNINDFGGAGRKVPLLSGALLIAGLSSLALPGTNSFVSEFLVLVGTYTTHHVYAIIATVGIIFAALYILLLIQRTMMGAPNPTLPPMRDMSGREALVIGPMIALILVLGVYPKPVLDIITPAVTATMHDINRSDPAPTAVGTTTRGGR